MSASKADNYPENAADTPPASPRRRRSSHRVDPERALQLSMKKAGKLKTENEHNQVKITKYLGNSNSFSGTRLAFSSLDNNQNHPNNSQIVALQEKLSQREALCQALKVKCEEQEAKRIAQVQKAREEKRRIQIQMLKGMLKVQEAKRKERAKVNYDLGYFTDRGFVEGEEIIHLRQQLQDTRKTLDRKQLARKTVQKGSGQQAGVLGSIEFYNRQLNQLQRQLQMREIELGQYKQRMRLVLKEKRSKYFSQNWPIIYQRYQTLQLLGSGGFGQVYKCYDIQEGKLVAIKTMKVDEKSSASAREEFFRHVSREGIQHQLDHPNIASLNRILQADEQKMTVVYQMQYCSGPELSVYLRRHRVLEQKEAKLIIKQVLAAVCYLASLKERIIHFDLKPSNIIFHCGEIKILDFGLCKIMPESDQTRIELTSQGVGTYWYLPPQTFDKYDPRISQKVDVWSVGVIFYEMLFGRKPFGHGMTQNQIYDKGVMLRARKVEFPVEHSRKHRVSEAAKEFIRECLRYNYMERLSPVQAFDHPYLKK